jgi:hypothetical protein
MKEVTEKVIITKEELTDLINSIGEHEIRVDIDSRDQFDDFLNRARLLQRALGLSIHNCLVYLTKSGYHVKIMLSTPLSCYEIILIQALLGDDYKHTLAAYVQLRQNVPLAHWNALFKEKVYLNHLGEPFVASEEHFDEVLTKKLYIYLTCQNVEVK